MGVDLEENRKASEFAAVVAVVAFAIALIAILSGCATTPDGERRVDRQLCEQQVEQAEAARLACGFIDDEENRARCELGAQMAVLAAQLGCSFADDVDGSELADE